MKRTIFAAFLALAPATAMAEGTGPDAAELRARLLPPGPSQLLGRDAFQNAMIGASVWIYQAAPPRLSPPAADPGQDPAPVAGKPADAPTPER